MIPRYFLATTRQGSVLGILQYNGSNEECDTATMNMVCEEIGGDDCELDSAFRIEDFKGSLTISGLVFHNGDPEKFELRFEEVKIY